MSDIDDAPLDTPGERVAAARRRVLAMLPVLRVGDVWRGVWCAHGEVTVTKFQSQEDYGIPWPLVLYTCGTELGEVGAPAFRFGELVRRGDGAEWLPMSATEAA